MSTYLDTIVNEDNAFISLLWLLNQVWSIETQFTGKKRMKKNKWYTALEMQKKDQTNKPHGLRNN